MQMKMQIVICENMSPLAFGAEIIEAIDGPGSHSAIIIESDGIAIVYEAKFPRARKIGFYEWSKHYRIIDCLTLDVPEKIQRPLVAELESMVGLPYGVPQLPLIAFQKLGHLFNRLFYGVKINGKTQLICTEICFRIIRAFLIHSSDESIDVVGLRDLRNEMNFIKSEGAKNAGFWLY